MVDKLHYVLTGKALALYSCQQKSLLEFLFIEIITTGQSSYVTVLSDC